MPPFCSGFITHAMIVERRGVSVCMKRPAREEGDERHSHTTTTVDLADVATGMQWPSKQAQVDMLDVIDGAVAASEPHYAGPLKWYVAVRDSLFRGVEQRGTEDHTERNRPESLRSWRLLGSSIASVLKQSGESPRHAVRSVVAAVDLEGCRALKDDGLAAFLEGLHHLGPVDTHRYVAVEGWYVASCGLTASGVGLLLRAPSASPLSLSQGQQPCSECPLPPLPAPSIHTLGLTNNRIFECSGSDAAIDMHHHPLLAWLEQRHGHALRRLHLNHVGMTGAAWETLRRIIVDSVACPQLEKVWLKQNPLVPETSRHMEGDTAMPWAKIFIW